MQTIVEALIGIVSFVWDILTASRIGRWLGLWGLTSLIGWAILTGLGVDGLWQWLPAVLIWPLWSGVRRYLLHPLTGG